MEPDELDESNLDVEQPELALEEEADILEEPKQKTAKELEKEQYSKNVQDRIGKEVWKRKVAEEERTRLAAQVETMRADLEALKSRSAEVDAQTAVGTLQDKLRAAQARLRKAKEEGDIDAELEAQTEMTDLHVEARLTSERAQRVTKQPEQPVVQRPQVPDTSSLPPGMRKWLDNNPWYLQGENKRAAMLANELDQELRLEGFDPADPDMYDELSKRLQAVFPKSNFIKPITAEKRSPKDLPPPTGAGSQDGSPKGAGIKRKLTQEDLDEMRSYGMDPTDKDNRVAWLRTHQ